MKFKTLCGCGCKEGDEYDVDVKLRIQEIDKKCIEVDRQAKIDRLASRVPLLASSDIVDYPYLPSTVMRVVMNYEKFQTIDGGFTKPEVIEATSSGIQGWADAKVHDDASTSASFESALDQAITNDGEVGRMSNQR